MGAVGAGLEQMSHVPVATKPRAAEGEGEDDLNRTPGALLLAAGAADAVDAADGAAALMMGCGVGGVRRAHEVQMRARRGVRRAGATGVAVDLQLLFVRCQRRQRIILRIILRATLLAEVPIDVMRRETRRLSRPRGSLLHEKSFALESLDGLDGAVLKLLFSNRNSC
jgi:hypothetical protein